MSGDADWDTAKYETCLCGHYRENCTCHVPKLGIFDRWIKERAEDCVNADRGEADDE